MKILLLVDDYLPTSTKIGAKMMHELGVELLSLGHQVSVVTPDHRIHTKFTKEVIDGVQIYRFKAKNVKDESKVKRAINETLLSWYAWWNLREVFNNESFGLIVYYSPSIFFGPLVQILKKKWGARSYLILRDIFPQWVIDHGLIKEHSPIAYYFKKFEALNYKVADKIGLQSPKNLKLFNEKYELSHKTEVLFNWSNEKPIVNTNNTYRAKLKLGEKIIFFYGGNMGEAQDMMNLVRLAENLKDQDNVHFVFAGSGNEFQLIENYIQKAKLNNLTLLQPVTQEVYPKMLSEFDIGLFSLHKDHSMHNFPGKLLGYMAQELPILGSVNPGNDVIEVIEKADAGYVSVNGNDDVFLTNALKLIKNTERRNMIGKNSFILLEKSFSVKAAVDTVIK
jgi:glycosyltransferase involved in cell wall biosynthesis